MKIHSESNSLISGWLRTIRNVLRMVALTTGSVVLLVSIIISVISPIFFGQNITYYWSKFINVLLLKDGLFYEPSLYLPHVKETILGLIEDDDFPRLDIQLKHADVANIREQIKGRDFNYVPAKVSVNGNGEQFVLDAKVRPKGDRLLHYYEFESMSFRVNLKGESRFMGLEEFSLQHPIVRNYTWEYLFAEVARSEGILSLMQGPVRFSVNGDRRGIYSFEEVPSKATLERQGRKEGPIFGLDETVGTLFPNVLYDVYEPKRWKSATNKTYMHARARLESLRLANLKEPRTRQDINKMFDMPKWAKFFALIDIFGAYHGGLPKSVKLYYSPTTGLIEPLVFDAHIGASGELNQFLLANFLKYNPDEMACDWICLYKAWFRVFFNENNPQFLAEYVNNLRRYSSVEFVHKISRIYTEKFLPVDRELYAEMATEDRIAYHGLFPYHFSLSRVKAKAGYVRKYLEDPLLVANLASKSLLGDSSSEDKLQPQESKIIIKELSNFSFSGSILSIAEPTIYILRGQTSFSGKDKRHRLRIEGPAMFVQLGGKIAIQNVEFNGPKNFGVIGRNWSGAINLINTEANLHNVIVKSADAEDAINAVDSSSNYSNVEVVKSKSDAIDLDFGELRASSVTCHFSGNDCLDTSGSNVLIDKLSARNVGDKVVSAGEGSTVTIHEVHASDSSVGVVSKDSSSLSVKTYSIDALELAGACYGKKSEWGSARITIEHQTSSKELVEYLVADSCVSNIPTAHAEIRVMKSEDIKSMMYGGKYGKATARQ